MSNIFYMPIDFVHNHIMFLNNSKFFAGVIMILLNIGSKFITIQFSKSTEEYLKMNVTKQLLVFSMAWMGTRDITNAIAVLEKAKSDKQKLTQRQTFTLFGNYLADSNKSFN